MDTKTENNNNFYRSDDLLVSSYLLCRQAQLVDIVSESSRHFVFIFLDPVKCKTLVHEYLNNGQAPARELFSRREELMSQIRDRNGYGNTYNPNNR